MKKLEIYNLFSVESLFVCNFYINYVLHPYIAEGREDRLIQVAFCIALQPICKTTQAAHALLPDTIAKNRHNSSTYAEYAYNLKSENK